MPDKRDAQGDLPRTARPDWRVRQPRRLLRQKIEPSRKEDSGRKQGLGRVAIRRHLEVLYKIGHRDQRGVRERKLFLDSLQSLSLLQTGYTGWHPAISHAVRQAGRCLFAGALAGSLIVASPFHDMRVMNMPVFRQFIIRGRVLIPAVYPEVATRKR